MAIVFSEIEKEFKETFGYVRQDIAAIRGKGLGLNCTVALLICCACEMLAWHKDMKGHEVFALLLPDEKSYQMIAKKMFDALRNGLAHSFRPQTIRIGGDEWRFSLAWQTGPHLSVIRGTPNWLRLNVKVFSERITDQINAYEVELRNSLPARRNFQLKAGKCVTEVPPNAKSLIVAWKSVLAGQ